MAEKMIAQNNEGTIEAILRTISTVKKLEENQSAPEAVRAFLEIAVNVYGKEKMLCAIADFGGKENRRFLKAISEIEETGRY